MIPLSKRQRLVDAARRITHAKGFSVTTLADVAAGAGVPLGNVYYYFRTKEALGDAVVDALVDHYREQRGLWECAADPKARLGAWIEMVEGQSRFLAASGCPVGSLCSELGKVSAPLRARAETIFTELLAFAEAQFRELGSGGAARGHALHLLASLQGASLLAHTFMDETIVSGETKALRSWIAGLRGGRKGRTR